MGQRVSINLPGEIELGNSWDALQRFHDAGVDVVSITLAGDNHNISQAFTLCAWARRQLREREDRMLLVRRVSDIDWPAAPAASASFCTSREHAASNATPP